MSSKTATTILHLANDVRDVQYRIHCASELIRLVHIAFAEGPNQADENDFDALFGASWLLNSLDTELEKKTAEFEELASQLIRQSKEEAK